MAPGPSTGRLRGKAQPEPKGKRRPPNGSFQRQKTVPRAPVDLARASNLGHRVIQRDEETSALTPEKMLRWQRSREQFRRQEKRATSAWRGKKQALKTLASELLALAEEMKRLRSEELARKFVAGTRRLIDLKRRHEALTLRLKVMLETGRKFDQWRSVRKPQRRPEDRRELAETHPEALYDRLYQETLLGQPLPDSLGTLAEELRGHNLHLKALKPDDPDFPHIEAYLERIDQLTGELRRLGVTAEDDTLYDLVTGDMGYQSSNVFNDVRIRRTPLGTLTHGERISFRVEKYYLAPGSTLEVEWLWCPKGHRDTRFFDGKPRKTRDLNLSLDESFWGWVPSIVLRQKGIQVVAYLYLNGGAYRRLASEWVPLQSKPRQGLLESVQVAAQPQRVIHGAEVMCTLTQWTPPELGYQVQWLVDGKEAQKGRKRFYDPKFFDTGMRRIQARIYRLDGGKWTLFHTTPETMVTVSPAEDIGRKTLDLFEEQGLPGFSTVRPGLEKTTAALKEKVATGGNDQSYWQQRLKAQQKRLEFLDREVSDPSSVKGLDQAAKPKQGSRYSTPVPAVMLHPEISGPVPLTLYLILQYRNKDQRDAKLLDLTGGDPLSYPGSGNSSKAATTAAIQYWQSKNPYPKGGTVSFRATGWDGADHFSTTSFEKTAKVWLDTALMVGGIALLVAPEFSGSKVAGTSLILASLARGSYAVYENLTLGVPWNDTRNVLEGLSIVGSVAGLGGGILRSLGAKASRAGIYRTGNALVLFGLGSDLSAAVVVTYQGMAMIQAIQNDPTLDDGQKASELVRITSMLLLNGVMTFASNRDLFTSPRGSLAGRALAPGESGNLGPKTRHALELEVKRRGQGKQLKANDGSPVSDRRLFEVFCKVRADEQRLTDVQAELGSDRARREFGRLVRSNRRHQPVEARTRVQLSRAFEVPVHHAPELGAGSVRVSYQVERGQVRKIVVRCGPGTSVDDVLRHAPTVQLLKRYRGMTGRLRSRLDRLRRFFGQGGPTSTDGLPFEAWGELLKLPGLIAARRKQLVHRDLQAGDRTRLENEIESLRRQLETYLPRVEELARGRGFIASESSSELPPHLQTVEQRRRVGEEVPSHVLAAPDYFVYDTNTRLWTLRRETFLKDPQTPVSKGNDPYFQFSWEKEDKHILIYLFYRPKTVSETGWFRGTLHPGKRFEDLEQVLKEGGPKDLRAVIDLRKLKEKAEGVPVSEMTKTSLAHPMMHDHLKPDGGRGWEVVHRGSENDLDSLFGQQGQVRWVAKWLGDRGFHLHVSFPRPTQDADIDHLLTLATHLNNYIALRSYGLTKGRNIGHKDLGVLGAEQRSELQRILLGDPKKLAQIDYFFKRQFVGIRRVPYKNSDRIGFEFRAYFGGKESPTEDLLRESLEVLFRPPDTKFSLGGDRRYSLQDLHRQDLVPSQKVLEDGLTETKLFDFLKDAADVAKSLPGTTLHPGHPAGMKRQQLLVRWSVPFVQWEKHPAIPKSAHDSIKAARHALIRRLEKIKDPDSTGATIVATRRTQHAIQEAISEWANATSLWRYF